MHLDERLKGMKQAIEEAELTRQKSAMIVLQVLLNAEHLLMVDDHYITAHLGLKRSFYIEIRKLKACHLLMRKQGLKIGESK